MYLRGWGGPSMIAILLCAGYATRLYPITENFPKPLLKIGSRPILNHLVADLSRGGFISKYVLVSNHKFVDFFTSWASQRKEDILVLDDGSTQNENRLGAVKDIQFAIEEGLIDDDVLVLAGDNLLDFSLNSFIHIFKRKKECCVMTHYEPNIEKLQKTGVIEIDTQKRILSMEEKPKLPKSHWAVPPFYIFDKKSLSKISEGIFKGCKVDAPGDFLSWLCQQTPVYAYTMPGRRFDIGTVGDYLQIKDMSGLI